MEGQLILNMPKVSVVAATCRTGGMELLKMSLQGQTFRDFELILVDRHCESRAGILKEYFADLGCSWTHVPPKIRTEYIDSAHAFNTGLALAKGELICFAGDYTYYLPTWIEEHWRVYEEFQGKASLIGIRHRVKPPPLRLWDEVLRASISIYVEELTPEKVSQLPTSVEELGKLRANRDMGNGRYEVSWRSFLLSANESLPLALLRAINGLDEDFDMRTWGHCDEDIGLRIAEMGHTFIYDTKASVPIHIEVKHLLSPKENTQVEPSLTLIARKLWALKEGTLNLVARQGIEADCPRSIIAAARDRWQEFDRQPGDVAQAILSLLGVEQGQNLYCTADAVGSASGGGAVTLNEAQALRSLNLGLRVISDSELNLSRSGLPDTPFLQDYLALELLSKTNQKVRLAHFYSGTFTQTVRYLKRQGALITYTVPAHDRLVTVEEHERLLGSYPFPHIKDDRLWKMFSGGYREADVVIAPSKLAAEFLSKEGCSRVQTIPHGCHLPEKAPPLPENFVVGYLGQVGVDKGLLYLAAAWAKLGYRDSELYLAGPGTETLALGSYVNSGRFRLLGFLLDVPRFYAGCQVMVFPSVCESFGIGILETMAHGRVVIASQGAGASELIEDGVDGLVVPIRNPDAIAERLQWCRKNQYRLPEMGRRAREKASKYTWEVVQKCYQQLWLGMLSPSK